MNHHSSVRCAVVLLLAGSALPLSTDAVADGAAFRPWLGGGAGMSRLSPDASDISQSLEDGDGNVLRGMVGLDLNHRFGLELGYTDLGEAGLSAGHHVSYYELSGDALIYGFANKARRDHRLGLLPFGRLGFSQMKNNSSLPFQRENDFSLHFGVGLEYGMRSGLAARAEVTSYDSDALATGVSLLYRFGGHNENFTPVIGAAKPVQVSPPVRTEPSATPVILSFEAILFDSDSDQIDKRARDQLIVIANTLKQAQRHDVTISGYADRRASDAYNLALSKKRAMRVLDELERLGLDVSDYRTRAMGETDEFGSMDTASGRRQNRRVIVVAKPAATLASRTGSTNAGLPFSIR